ncbi:MAG: flagellar biosynthesis anti-sigma factor FlgM [bacterium]
MVVNNISGNEVPKKVSGTANVTSGYEKTLEGTKKTETDKVTVSSRAKLLHSLRKKYDEVETGSQSVKEIKQKLEEGVHKLSAEEIVREILRGTIFEVT